MAGLLGWLLSTFWSREYVLRRSKYNVPLPEQCHVTLDEETIAGRPVFVVGDVHGCCEELCQLLQLAENRRKNPFIMFVGDMVNKGPQNVDVLRLVKEMSRHGQAACVRGNHEESVLRELWRVRMSPETYCLAHRSCPTPSACPPRGRWWSTPVWCPVCLWRCRVWRTSRICAALFRAERTSALGGISWAPTESMMGNPGLRCGRGRSMCTLVTMLGEGCRGGLSLRGWTRAVCTAAS